MATKKPTKSPQDNDSKNQRHGSPESDPVRNHALNATYRGVLNNQILVEQQARYLHKTDPLKTAVLSYRASYSLQQACQAKLGEPTDKTVFL